MGDPHTETTDTPEFDATLWMALADSWWELGKRTAPLIGERVTKEEREGHIRSWVRLIQENVDEGVKAAVTPEALNEFVRTCLLYTSDAADE